MASHYMRIKSIFVATLLATNITNKRVSVAMATNMDVIQNLILK